MIKINKCKRAERKYNKMRKKYLKGGFVMSEHLLALLREGIKKGEKLRVSLVKKGGR